MSNVSTRGLCSGTETFHNLAAQIAQRGEESAGEGADFLAVGDEHNARVNALVNCWPIGFTY